MAQIDMIRFAIKPKPEKLSARLNLEVISKPHPKLWLQSQTNLYDLSSYRPLVR